jgi:nucleolin
MDLLFRAFGMSKSKSKGSKGGAMPDTTILTKVKDASVTKSAHTPKAKSKEIAKQVATKSEKRSKHQKVKEPTPEPDSDSDSEESASSVSASASEIESESEAEVPTKNCIASGRALANPEAVGEDDDSEEASGEDSASSESSDDEPAAHGVLPATTTPAAVNGKSKPDADSSDESESSDSDEEGDKKKPAVTKKPINADQLTKKLPPMASKKTALVNEPDESEEDGEDSEDSEASSGSSDESSEDDEKEEEEEEDIEPKRAISKRKAEEEAAPAVKKAKTVPDANGSQGKNLFVGSLSWNVDEEWLTREFEEFGELTGVRIITDRNTGRSKG